VSGRDAGLVVGLEEEDKMSGLKIIKISGSHAKGIRVFSHYSLTP
jgi:hypothetical protein